MSKHDSNITVHVWAPDIRSQVEKAKLTLEHYAVEFSTAHEAWEKRMARIEAWKSKRRDMNFRYYWNKAIRQAEIKLRGEFDYAFESWKIASERAAESYANQKVAWFQFKTPLSEYQAVYGVEVKGKIMDYRRERMSDIRVIEEYAVSEFLSTVRNARIYAKQLTLMAPHCERLAYRMTMFVNADIRHERWSRQWGPCKSKYRRECNLPPLPHPHLSHSVSLHNLNKAIKEADSHMINVPAPILAAVKTINGEEA